MEERRTEEKGRQKRRIWMHKETKAKCYCSVYTFSNKQLKKYVKQSKKYVNLFVIGSHNVVAGLRIGMLADQTKLGNLLFYFLLVRFLHKTQQKLFLLIEDNYW